jgi:two-component system sensor histidine kinase PilS (NtrC family)
MGTPERTEAASSWFGADGIPQAVDARTAINRGASGRLWHGFMNARVMVALVLLLMQASAYFLGQGLSFLLLNLCILYLVATVAVRLLARPPAPGQNFDRQWVITIAVDVVAFSAMQLLHGGTINYTPLFALPVLLAAVLGSRLLALGTTAAVTLLLLADAWWISLHLPAETASRLLQAALTGTGLFFVAFLTNQLASRLSREEEAARRNAREVRVQTMVNHLVIENLTDGVLVIDNDFIVRAANPSARALLDWVQPTRPAPFRLSSERAWQPLARLADATFMRAGPQSADVDLRRAGLPHCWLRVRTQLAATLAEGTESLCVMFLQDRRETEARVRTEKLAAMGRMSAAVAHEIRNPLAAIAQANALLDEELSDPAQKRLTLMVKQNAKRLARIVDEILDVARVEHFSVGATGSRVLLHESVQTMCIEWSKQNGDPRNLRLSLSSGAVHARFEPDHLRRVLVNLLDNALRYAGPGMPVEVTTETSSQGRPQMMVWSAGEPLEQTVERHLFEPFFTSESRSSGLGLYICRELCERHDAEIAYERTSRDHDGKLAWGNEFSVSFEPAGEVTRTGFDSRLPAQ